MLSGLSFSVEELGTLLVLAFYHGVAYQLELVNIAKFT
jgi:hypothetical protein